MKFTEQDKLTALAIVHVFETSRPLGDFAACVVLNDGAGISYGINQFTHRSGSLAAVVARYLASGAQVSRAILEDRLPFLEKTTNTAVARLSADTMLKQALKAAAATPEMRAAERQIAFELYLGPALNICRARGFMLPLSLAVVYDSIVHGSWGRISSGVRTDVHDEKGWITEYVRRRDAWFASVPRLVVGRYRTRFFLGQIATGNWALALPLNVHGAHLTAATFAQLDIDKTETSPVVAENAPVPAADAETPIGKSIIDEVTERFESVEGAVSSVTTRADSVKSLWTTVLGTLGQVAWAVFGYLAGLPTAVWIVVALIAAALVAGYLYRQIELGRIRELKTRE